MATTFGCEVSPFPQTYLGLPLSPYKLKLCDFAPIISKSDMRLSGWRGRCLHIGGWLILVNFVLTAMLSHAMAAVLLPAPVIEAIDKRRRAFLSTGEETCNGEKTPNCKGVFIKIPLVFYLQLGRQLPGRAPVVDPGGEILAAPPSPGRIRPPRRPPPPHPYPLPLPGSHLLSAPRAQQTLAAQTSPAPPSRASPRPAEQPRRSAVESSSIPANQRKPRLLESSESSSASIAGHRLSPAIPSSSGLSTKPLASVVSSRENSKLLGRQLPGRAPAVDPGGEMLAAPPSPGRIRPPCRPPPPHPYPLPGSPLLSAPRAQQTLAAQTSPAPPSRASPRPAEQPRRSAVESSSIPANQRKPRRLESSESSSASIAGHRLSPAIPSSSGLSTKPLASVVSSRC
nr:vegetative cell wall protein gp1-like [Lolium perenne]